MSRAAKKQLPHTHEKCAMVHKFPCPACGRKAVMLNGADIGPLAGPVELIRRNYECSECHKPFTTEERIKFLTPAMPVEAIETIKKAAALRATAELKAKIQELLNVS